MSGGSGYSKPGSNPGDFTEDSTISNRANNTSTLYEGEITQITPRPGFTLSAHNQNNRANNTSTLYEGEITQITPRPGFTLSAHNQKYGCSGVRERADEFLTDSLLMGGAHQ
ncbi:hypothetical protein T4A_9373 [Trichinella pseudospiralis]|uniref:Uncharacterized protein n=1 Tax=Trichinella pseudospiralis TaxID=6337 RepID=A0A0V1EDZ3_TRIPS|nr:hypothetical protein T4A_9373 [Trichinella pseudospiralis]